MDEGEDPNNYKTTPLVGDELGFASNIIKKHFEKNKIFLLSTVQLSLYHMGKQKLKDENKKLQMIIKKQQLETITAETQKGLENIPKIDDVETLTKIIDQQTKANIKKETNKLEKKIINNGIFKTIKKATGGGQNPNTKARKNGTSSKGSSRKQPQNQNNNKKNQKLSNQKSKKRVHQNAHDQDVPASKKNKKNTKDTGVAKKGKPKGQKRKKRQA